MERQFGLEMEIAGAGREAEITDIRPVNSSSNDIADIRRIRKDISAVVESVRDELHGIMRNLDSICGQTGFSMEHDRENALKTGNECFADSMRRLESLRNGLSRLQERFCALAGGFGTN